MFALFRVGLSVILSAMLLASCGGGSGSDGGNPSTGGSAGAGTYSLSGSIADGGGLEIKVEGPVARTTTVDVSGAYQFSDLPSGTYVVTPIDDVATFSPASRTITIGTANVLADAFAQVLPADTLAQATQERIDGQPEASIPDSQVTLPDGQNLYDYLRARGLGVGATGRSSRQQAADPAMKRKDAIAQMMASARDYACGRSDTPCTKWDYEKDDTAPDLRPAQKGLAYVYGGKTPLVRTAPLGACSSTELHGLDCSGLISLVASAAGISASGDSASLANPSAWNVPSEWGTKMEVVTDGTIEAGDIVAWSGHIGIATSGGSDAVVISSTGRDGKANCLKNRTPPRGPRALRISQLGLGAPTQVLRLSALSTFSGPVSLTGPASITGSTCTGTMTVVGNGTIRLAPSPALVLAVTEAINLSCYNQSVPGTITVPLTLSGAALSGTLDSPFTCAPPCVTGTSGYKANLVINKSGASQSVTGTIDHTNSNQTPFSASATGSIEFKPSAPALQ